MKDKIKIVLGVLVVFIMLVSTSFLSTLAYFGINKTQYTQARTDVAAEISQEISNNIDRCGNNAVALVRDTTSKNITVQCIK